MVVPRQCGSGAIRDYNVCAGLEGGGELALLWLRGGQRWVFGGHWFSKLTESNVS